MSHTIAHRPHVQHHVPAMPVIAVIVAIVIATAIIWAINQPQPTTMTPAAETIGQSAVQPAAVALPESPVARHAQMRVDVAGGYPRAYVVNQHHLVNGASLDPVSTRPTGSYEQPDYPRVGQ
jgi:hypothetical protein